jgi:hypothetical protein
VSGLAPVPYNTPVTEDTKQPQRADDSPPDDQKESPGQPPPESDAPATGTSSAKPTPEVPILITPSSDARWRGGGGLSRWTTWGCALGIMVLIAMLIFGVAITKKTAWMTFDRSQRRVVAAAEKLNDPAMRMRTVRNLERYKVQLRMKRDPFPVMGEFLKLVREGFDDGTLTAGELEEINLHLESHLPVGAALE